MLPHEVLTELLGHFCLKGSAEQQIQICEDIASNLYPDLKAALEAIEPYAKTPIRFEIEVEGVLNNPFFTKYLPKPKHIAPIVPLLVLPPPKHGKSGPKK